MDKASSRLKATVGPMMNAKSPTWLAVKVHSLFPTGSGFESYRAC